MNLKNEQFFLSSLFELLPKIKEHHKPGTLIYNFFQEQLSKCVLQLWGKDKNQIHDIADIKNISMPYFEMGNINSTHLFALDELIIFSFYKKNKSMYSKVYDLGANIGLHSIILGKLNYEVVSYEPDPNHFAELKKNIKGNDISNNVILINKAVSFKDGEANFTRVLGNTTGSHISGSKNEPYGGIETFKVELENIDKVFKDADLIKMDIEGHEAEAITSLSTFHWEATDVILEVGSEKNALEIFKYFNLKKNINLFSQKNSWSKVTNEEHMPTSHRDGSLFITSKTQMPW
tara:strand:- start:48494 stop:49366 length:873 start_codon:yes stop_codon:yes gene_type:complete